MAQKEPNKTHAKHTWSQKNIIVTQDILLRWAKNIVFYLEFKAVCVLQI